MSLLTEEPILIPEALPALPLARDLKRVLWPNRNRLELWACELDALLPEGHRARLVTAYVMQVNLNPLYAGIRALENGLGGVAIAPKVRFALWWYAALERLGSACASPRHLAR